MIIGSKYTKTLGKALKLTSDRTHNKKSDVPISCYSCLMRIFEDYIKIEYREDGHEFKFYLHPKCLESISHEESMKN